MTPSEFRRLLNPLGAHLPFSVEGLPNITPSRVVRRTIRAVDVLQDLFKPLTRPKHIVLLGGLGDLTSRFLVPAWQNLNGGVSEIAPTFSFTAVGRREEEEAINRLEEIRHAGFPLTNYLPEKRYRELVEAGLLQADAVFVATLPKDHLVHCKYHLENTDGLVFCEKPLFTPRDLKEAQGIIVNYGKRLIPVDHFFFCLPLIWLRLTGEGRECLARYSDPISISGTVMEVQPAEPERFGGGLGLLRQDLSGGGMLLDCAVHSGATVGLFQDGSEPYERHIRLSSYLTKDYLSDVGISDDPSSFRETGGVVQRIYKDHVVSYQGFKGSFCNAYFLQLIGRNGAQLIIGTGDEKRPPYIIELREDGAVEVNTFETNEISIGYEAFFLLASSLIEETCFPENFPALSTLQRAALCALEDISEAEHIPSSAYLPYRLRTQPTHCLHVPLDLIALVEERKGAHTSPRF